MKVRKTTRIACQWCGEDHDAKRSDKKYCCDSCKTMACRQRRKDEEILRNPTGNGQTECKTEIIYSTSYYEKIENQKIQEQKSRLDQELAKKRAEQIENQKRIEREEQRAKAMVEEIADFRRSMERSNYESLLKELSKLANKLLKFAEQGWLVRTDIRNLTFDKDRILRNDKIQHDPLFQRHFLFIKNKLSDYLDDLKEQERDCEYRELDIELPVEIIVGLGLLQMPVRWKGEMVGVEK